MMENHQEPNGQKQKSTAAFPSVLIALVALAVIAFVGWKLLQPPPAPPVPAEKPAAATPAPTTPVETPKAGAELATNTEDPICGMNPQRSAQRVEAKFTDGKLLAFDSLACYYEYVEKDTEAAPVRERVVAYDTYKNAEPLLLEFSDAVWLIGLERPVSGAMPPGAAAFRTEEDARKAMGNLGGRVATAAEMKDYVYQYLKDNGVIQ
jgi:nitrous oxide reductase accessory protein NosL